MVPGPWWNLALACEDLFEVVAIVHDQAAQGVCRLVRPAEWIDVLMRTMGYESVEMDRRLKRLFLLRLAPLCERQFGDLHFAAGAATQAFLLIPRTANRRPLLLTDEDRYATLDVQALPGGSGCGEAMPATPLAQRSPPPAG